MFSYQYMVVTEQRFGNFYDDSSEKELLNHRDFLDRGKQEVMR